MRSFIVLLLLNVLATGCVSLSKDECTSTDWAQKGSVDALKGYERSMIDKYEAACTKSGAKADRTAYSIGYSSGLQAFCTPAAAAEYGSRGEPYRYTCSKDLEPAFLHAYNPAYRAHADAASERFKEKQIEDKERVLGVSHSVAELLVKNNKRACTSDRSCSSGGKCESVELCDGSWCENVNVCEY